MNEFVVITLREMFAFGMLFVPLAIEGNQHDIGWSMLRVAVTAALHGVEPVLTSYIPEYDIREISQPQTEKSGAPVFAVVQVVVRTERAVPLDVQAECHARALIAAGLAKAGNSAPLLDAFGPGLPQAVVLEVERMLPEILSVVGGKRFDVPVAAEAGGKSIHLEGALARKPPPARPEDTSHDFDGLLVGLDFDAQTIALKIPAMRKQKVQFDRDAQFPDIFKLIEGGRGSPVPVRGRFVTTSDVRGQPCNRLEWIKRLQGDDFSLA